MKSIEIFAGGGGLALGVKEAGFSHSRLIEWDNDSAKTLYHNYRNFGFDNENQWIINDDIRNIFLLSLPLSPLCIKRIPFPKNAVRVSLYGLISFS